MVCWIKLHINSPIPLQYLFVSGKWNTFPKNNVDAAISNTDNFLNKSICCYCFVLGFVCGFFGMVGSAIVIPFSELTLQGGTSKYEVAFIQSKMFRNINILLFYIVEILFSDCNWKTSSSLTILVYSYLSYLFNEKGQINQCVCVYTWMGLLL